MHDAIGRSKKLAVAMAAAVLLLLVGCERIASSPLGGQLDTGVAVAAKQLCSLVFVSGLDPERARALYLEPILRGGLSIMWIDLDAAAGSVTARVPGIVMRRALHRPGYGCTLVRDDGADLQPPPPAVSASSPMSLDRSHRDAVFDAGRLDAALATAFREEPGAPPLQTLAVVVLHDGRLVAERYAEGITPDTRLPAWSMTKSVTATLVGVMVEQGLLDVHAPGVIRAWRGTNDPRAQISLDHLLRMTSGLDLAEAGEHGDGLDPTSVMLYQESDAAGYAASRALRRDVGTHFEYMSGNTILAMRAVQDGIGAGLSDAHRFFQEHLFAPLGMQRVVLEPDEAGTFLGSTHLLASARDWARFGRLYLDGGMAGGRRIVPARWLDYVTTPTAPSTASQRGGVFWEPGRSAYGAGFWLVGDDTRERAWTRATLPPDAFDANGFQGQYTHIIRSRRLVVVRLGATNFRGHDHERLPIEVVAAMK